MKRSAYITAESKEWFSTVWAVENPPAQGALYRSRSKLRCHLWGFFHGYGWLPVK